MGRWSASHWKTAVFGWLAFVVVAVVLGMAVGTKNIDEQRRQRRPGAPRRPHPQGRRLPGRPADRDRAGPEQDAHGRRPRVPRRRQRRRGTRTALQDDQEPPLAVRPGARRPGLDGRPHGDGRVGHEGRQRRSPTKHIDALTAATDKRGEGAPGLLRRRGRLDQLRQGARQDVQRAARAGRRALDPADARHPAARLRRDRRRRRAAAARPLRRHRHARPASRCRATSCRWTRTSAPCSCSSVSRSASTTRSSTSSASGKSGRPARGTAPHSKPPPRPPAARC